MMNIQQNWWAAYPMLRILPALVGGIILYDLLPSHQPSEGITVIAPLFITYLLVSLRPIPKPRWIFSLPLICLFAALGFYLMHAADVRNQRHWLGACQTGENDFIVKFARESRITKKGFASVVRIIGRKSGSDRWHPCSATVWVNHQHPAFSKGTLAMMRTGLEPVTAEKARTNGFYQYLLRKNITHFSGSAYLSPLGPQQSADLPLWVRSRNGLSFILDSLFPNGNVRNMAGALMIGERASLPQDMTKAYVNTGVVHVIAISGMHLALLYAVLAQLLSFLKKGRSKWLYTLLCISWLWFYASICGNAPSVVRSAWMFSFMLAGNLLSKSHKTGNSLAASAVVMLCIDPLLLWDLGFQLSYAAVASLLIYQKSISNSWQPNNKILMHGWTLVSTTLAAQILTTPLAIYHFGQFPLIFLVSNMVAVPISGLILLLLGITCLLFPLGCSAPLASICSFLIHFMNNRIMALGTVENAAISGLHLSLPGTINCYILILSLTLWIRSKKR